MKKRCLAVEEGVCQRLNRKRVPESVFGVDLNKEDKERKLDVPVGASED